MDDAVYSGDDHPDLRSVPVDLWQSRVPSAAAGRAPRVVDHERRMTWTGNDGGASLFRYGHAG